MFCSRLRNNTDRRDFLCQRKWRLFTRDWAGTTRSPPLSTICFHGFVRIRCSAGFGRAPAASTRTTANVSWQSILSRKPPEGRLCSLHALLIGHSRHVQSARTRARRSRHLRPQLGSRNRRSIARPSSSGGSPARPAPRSRAGAHSPASVFVDIIGFRFTSLLVAGLARRTARAFNKKLLRESAPAE